MRTALSVAVGLGSAVAAFGWILYTTHPHRIWPIRGIVGGVAIVFLGATVAAVIAP